MLYGRILRFSIFVKPSVDMFLSGFLKQHRTLNQIYTKMNELEYFYFFDESKISFFFYIDFFFVPLVDEREKVKNMGMNIPAPFSYE
jgi:hypothetical protein